MREGTQRQVDLPARPRQRGVPENQRLLNRAQRTAPRSAKRQPPPSQSRPADRPHSGHSYDLDLMR